MRTSLLAPLFLHCVKKDVFAVTPRAVVYGYKYNPKDIKSMIEIIEPEIRVWFDEGDLPINGTPFINGQDSSRL